MRKQPIIDCYLNKKKVQKLQKKTNPLKQYSYAKDIVALFE